MSTWNNIPYSYVTGSDRLLGPVNSASNPAYDFKASSSLVQDATAFGTDAPIYVLKPVGTGGSTPPSAAPPIPTLAMRPGPTNITVQFNTAGITGSPPPTYLVLYGTTTSPTTPFIATRAIGSLYTGQVVGLQVNTTYYFKSVAVNESGSKTSAVSVGISTSTGSSIAPSGPPTVPAVSGVPTNSSITVTFDVAGITGTPTPTYSILAGTTTTPAGPFSATLVTGTTYTATATGLAPNTSYFFKSVAANGVVPDAISAVSAAIATAGATPTGPLRTNLVTPFLLQGPRFNTPYAQALDYYINVDAVGCTLAVGATSIAGAQDYGYMYGGSLVTGGEVSNAGVCSSDQPYSAAYGPISDAYLKPLQPASRVLACWGGFYADILGLFGPYQPAGFPGTNPTAAQVVDSFLFNFCGVAAATNPLNWSRAGYTFYYDGLVLDFENVGYGGRPSSNQYPLPQATAPNFPADATNPTYSGYIAALASIVSEWYVKAPTLFLSNAPLSLSINGDALTALRGGNLCASNSALNTWFAFASSSTVPSAATYNAAASLALNHPEQMSYFDDVFVQFYNELPDRYLGGVYFANLLAQWGYVALRAQTYGRKKTRVNIGLARGNIIPGGSPAVASAQGPTPALDSLTAPPYEFFYPQYATVSPPNSTSAAQNAQYWPNTSPQLDPQHLATAITAANLILQTATGTPTLQPVEWCSGMGFWAGSVASASAQAVYTAGNLLSPGAVLPALQTYLWSDASYPSPAPLWPSHAPIINNL